LNDYIIFDLRFALIYVFEPDLMQAIVDKVK